MIPRVSSKNLPRASLKAEFYQWTQFWVKGMLQMNSTKPTNDSRMRANFQDNKVTDTLRRRVYERSV